MAVRLTVGLLRTNLRKPDMPLGSLSVLRSRLRLLTALSTSTSSRFKTNTWSLSRLLQVQGWLATWTFMSRTPTEVRSLCGCPQVGLSGGHLLRGRLPNKGQHTTLFLGRNPLTLRKTDTSRHMPLSA